MVNRKLCMLMPLVLSIILLFGFIACESPTNNDRFNDRFENNPVDENPADETQPSSVGDYSHLEPDMASNPSRATARTGGTVQIGIPDYLLPFSPSAGVRSVLDDVNATFEVHEDDTAIAEIVSQDGSTANIRGLQLGSARIIVTVGSQSATMIIAVAPSQALYTLPAASVRRLGEEEFYEAWWNSSRPDGLPSDIDDYTAEPTFQLAWNWRNPSRNFGASGTNCGFDILAYFIDPVVANRRGWVRTTYGFGGWFYNLNGVTSAMIDGVQEEGDVRLELEPEFIYDNGIPYLQITHVLTNTGSSRLTGQKFGASADVMIIGQDDAPLTHLEYGALMTNENSYGEIVYLPTIKFRLVCQNVQGIDDVSTLWFGRYGGGSHRDFIYDDEREDITAQQSIDTAIGFSYQNIELNPGQSRRYVVRFTQVQ